MFDLQRNQLDIRIQRIKNYRKTAITLQNQYIYKILNLQLLVKKQKFIKINVLVLTQQNLNRCVLLE